MNQLYRAALMPKKRLIKKFLGHKEVYTLCIRKVNDNDLLKSKEKACFKKFFQKDHYWYADPISQEYQGVRALFTEQFDIRTQKGVISCSVLKENSFSEPKVIIDEEFHMSFPMTFLWNNAIFMIPETSHDRSIRLYKAVSFPYEWTLEKRFSCDLSLVDNVILEVKDDKITVLASEVNRLNALKVRFVKYYLIRENESYKIVFDKKYNSNQKFNYNDRNAGKVIVTETDMVLPTQVSTNIDYGVYLNFRRIDRKSSLLTDSIKTIFLNQISVEGIPPSAMIGVHSYDRIDDYEIIDLRYLE